MTGWLINLLTYFAPRIRLQHSRWLKSRGQYCGDIELAGYLANESGPVPLVLDLRISHDRVGSSADPTLNGHLKYPHNLDQSLNDAAADKIRKYRADYNNSPPSAVSFMPAIASTSGRLHIEFIRLLVSQAHRETDRFFAASGVQLEPLHRPTVDSSTTAVRHTLLRSNQNVETFSLRLQLYVLILT